MIRTKFPALCFLALAASPAPGTAATSPGAAKEELRELKSRIEAVQEQLTRAEESRTDAADALSESERAISDANRTLTELAGQSRAANLRLAQLKDEAGTCAYFPGIQAQHGRSAA
ncbi:MAG: hypothetical protein ACXWVP_08670 [Burkholderiales bacterium]